MRQLVVAVVVAAIVGAGMGYWFAERTASNLQQALDAQRNQLEAMSRALTDGADIKLSTLVYRGGGDQCLSSTTAKEKGYRGYYARWHVHKVGNGVNRCFESGQTVVIVAKSGTPPLDPPEPFSDKVIEARLKTATPKYEYEVWMADKTGKRLYKMEDPELEIAETRPPALPGSAQPPPPVRPR